MVLSRRSTKAESDASRRSRSSSATLSNGQRIPEDVLRRVLTREPLRSRVTGSPLLRACREIVIETVMRP
jgi:hypothetical protein